MNAIAPSSDDWSLWRWIFWRSNRNKHKQRMRRKQNAVAECLMTFLTEDGESDEWNETCIEPGRGGVGESAHSFNFGWRSELVSSIHFRLLSFHSGDVDLIAIRSAKWREHTARHKSLNDFDFIPVCFGLLLPFALFFYYNRRQSVIKWNVNGLVYFRHGLRLDFITRNVV